MKIIRYASLVLAVGAAVGVLAGATHQWFMATVAFILFLACGEDDLEDRKSND